MAKLVGQPMNVELLCAMHDDGSYDGRIREGGVIQPDPNLIVLKGDCEALRNLWKRARDIYGVNPVVVGNCQDCFPPDFLAAESV